MRHLPVVCLAALAVVAFQSPAEAGRRGRRAARTAVVAGAAVAVAAAPRQRTVVAAAYPVAVGRAAATVVMTPDLTITDMSAVGDKLCITVQNIGPAASPQTALQLTMCAPVDDAVFAEQCCRVLPLAANQSVRMHVRSAPLAAGTIAAVVDPDQQVVETSEQNNSLEITIAAPAEELALPALEDEADWHQE